MDNLEFSLQVKNALGGITKVASITTKCITRGFDLQMYMIKKIDKINLIKVTTENDILEVMFYNYEPKRRILNKIKTVEIQSLDELSLLLEKWL